jgi:hypothetical protein
MEVNETTHLKKESGGFKNYHVSNRSTSAPTYKRVTEQEDVDEALRKLERDKRRERELARKHHHSTSSINRINQMELLLVQSILICEESKVLVNNKIAEAFELQQLRMRLFGMLRTPLAPIQKVEDYKDFVASCESVRELSEAAVISEHQLSLDLMSFEQEYRYIVSILLYLKQLTSPIDYFISRTRLAYLPKKKGSEAPLSLLDSIVRFFETLGQKGEPLIQAHYYEIVIDLPLSKRLVAVK